MNDGSARKTFTIAAPVDRTWAALLREVDRFWPEEMLSLGPSSRPALEPQLGGRLYEYRADGAGLLLATVVEIVPEISVSLQTTAGAVGVGLVTIALSQSVMAGSTVILTVRPADTSGFWARLVESGLKPYLEAPRAV